MIVFFNGQSMVHEWFINRESPVCQQIMLDDGYELQVLRMINA